MDGEQVFTLILWIIAMLLAFVIYLWQVNKKTKAQFNFFNNLSHQSDTNNIYSISGGLNGQNTSLPDAFLSVEHIAITNEMNKPPKYDDAPPSYEEAIKLAVAQNNSIRSYQAEQGHTSSQPESSGPPTTTSITVVVAAIPTATTRTTE